MKTWEYIELSDGYGIGFTNDDYSFIETEVQGYNDTKNFSDLEDLLTVRLVWVVDKRNSTFKLTIIIKK